MSDENKLRPFDAVSTLERWSEYWRRFPQYGKGKRLDFTQRCSVYACLYANKIPQGVVCHMFNISRATVSYIAGCRDDHRKPLVIEQPSGLIDKKTGLEIIHQETIGVDGYLTKNRNEDRRPRYQNIADEFERLGEAKFMETYYTPAVHERMRAVRELKTGKIYPNDMKKTVDRDSR